MVSIVFLTFFVMSLLTNILGVIAIGAGMA